jgi:hypothetical protein
METPSANPAAMPAFPELPKEIRAPHDDAYHSTLSLNDIENFENEASVEHVKLIGYMTLDLGIGDFLPSSLQNPSPEPPLNLIYNNRKYHTTNSYPASTSASAQQKSHQQSPSLSNQLPPLHIPLLPHPEFKYEESNWRPDSEYGV